MGWGPVSFAGCNAGAIWMQVQPGWRITCRLKVSLSPEGGALGQSLGGNSQAGADYVPDALDQTGAGGLRFQCLPGKPKRLGLS